MAPQLEAELEAANGRLNSRAARAAADTPTRGRTTLPRAFSLSSDASSRWRQGPVGRSNPLEALARPPTRWSAGAAAATGPFASLTLPDSRHTGASEAARLPPPRLRHLRRLQPHDGNVRRPPPADGVTDRDQSPLARLPAATNAAAAASGDAIVARRGGRSHLGSVSRLTRRRRAMCSGHGDAPERQRLRMDVARLAGGADVGRLAQIPDRARSVGGGGGGGRGGGGVGGAPPRVAGGRGAGGDRVRAAAAAEPPQE